MANSPEDYRSPADALRHELRENFAAVDSDADGSVDFGEFSDLMENLEAEMSAEELRIGFDEIDADHDGRVDFREFVAWWTDT